MTDAIPQMPARKLIGEFAPKLVSLTDDVLFGNVWARRVVTPRAQPDHRRFVDHRGNTE